LPGLQAVSAIELRQQPALHLRGGPLSFYFAKCAWRARLAYRPRTFTVEEGDTDTAPYGLGTYGSRSTPVAGAATAMAGGKIRAKAQMIAAYLLEVHDDDLEWEVGRFRVKGVPERQETMTEIAFAAYNKVPPGMEPGLEAVSYYDPPNMTYPFGAYVCVVDIDVDTGVTEIEQVANQGAADLVTLRLQRLRQTAHALAGPPQRRFRIPAGRDALLGEQHLNGAHISGAVEAPEGDFGHECVTPIDVPCSRAVQLRMK
jgi:hypothetical protein